MASADLIAMAILQENWTEDRDYLANFEPFLVDILRSWPAAEPVDPTEVAKQLSGLVGFRVPANVTGTVLRRARKAGLVRSSQQGQFVVPDKLDEKGELATARERARNQMDDLVRRLREHALQAHGLDWNDSEVEQALGDFLDDFGVDFLNDSRVGKQSAAPAKTAKRVAAVQSFARHSFEHDQHALSLLEQAVKGSMLATVLHYRPDRTPKKLRSVIAYLDTPIVLRLLGVAIPQLTDAASEMRQLLSENNVSCRIFRHTETEVRNVLHSTAGNLRASRSKAQSNVSHLSRTSREVLDYFIAEGKNAGDVQAVIANLEAQLRANGIEIEDVPDHEQRLTLDEGAIAEQLDAKIRYRNEGAKHRDVDSLTAIHRLRRGNTYAELADCRAVFVTSNTGYARVARKFMSAEGHGAGVPHVMSDLELTTQLWVRTPGARSALPRKLVIADSYAALNPPSRLWDKYLGKIKQLEESGEVSNEQVTGLIFSTVARNEVMEITLGDPEALTEETVVDVLNHLADHVTGPAIRAARAEVEAQRTNGKQETSELQAQVDSERAKGEQKAAALQKQLDSERRGRQEERARNRRRLGTLAAVAPLAGAVALLVTQVLNGWLEVGVVLALCAAASAFYAIGCRSYKAAWVALLAIFAVVGGVAAVQQIANDGSESPGKPTPTPSSTAEK